MSRLFREMGRWLRQGGMSAGPSISSPPTITVPSGNGPVSYTLPETLNPDQDSVLQFSVPKCGTIMSSGIASQLANAQGVRFVGLTSALDFSGEHRLPAAAKPLFLPKGYCYGAITSYPADFDIPIIAQCRSTLIVRDPRDLFVSLYYSMKQSHPEPSEEVAQVGRERFEYARHFARENNIDSFVSRAMPSIHAIYSSYARILGLQTLKVFRYEDVVYRKREWVAEICDHFRWNIRQAERNAIADAYDIFPDQETQNSHVRQVHPGNHKAQLHDSTIRRIEVVFAEEMRTFGYQTLDHGLPADATS